MEKTRGGFWVEDTFNNQPSMKESVVVLAQLTWYQNVVFALGATAVVRTRTARYNTQKTHEQPTDHHCTRHTPQARTGGDPFDIKR